MNAVDLATKTASPAMSAARGTVGAAITAFLEACGVKLAFGVISIHNMPILDAMGERGTIRFVTARGEAGAASMADAAARVTGSLGVVLTSTGTACGNAAGGMVEAQTAGTPLVHITGQIEAPYLDRDMAYIHEAKDQLTLLKAVSKAAFRVRAPEEALPTLKRAVQIALTAPSGPVSVEIPIDIQAAEIPWPTDLAPLPIRAAAPDEAALDRLADALATAKRPLIWAGGGARGAGKGLRALLDLGFGLMTSTQGRGTIPESDPRALGAFSVSPPMEALFKTCDAMLAVGTRLRGNETLKYKLGLPQPFYRIDADPASDGRGYANAAFVEGDAALALEGLAARLAGRMHIDPAFGDDLAATKSAAIAGLHRALGSGHTAWMEAIAAAIGHGAPWVRDVTLSNSMWGNRMPPLMQPRQGVHALGGGIGLGLSMGIGAALARPDAKTFALIGDGGLQLGLAELATAVEQEAPLVMLVMNSGGYGVIKNIQDAAYGGRRRYVDLLTPDFAALCASIGMTHRRLRDFAEGPAALDWAKQQQGPVMLEVDMASAGDFATNFAGPPVRKPA